MIRNSKLIVEIIVIDVFIVCVSIGKMAFVGSENTVMLRSRIKTYCAWYRGVGQRLKILTYAQYAPVFRCCPPCSTGTRDDF